MRWTMRRFICGRWGVSVLLLSWGMTTFSAAWGQEQRVPGPRRPAQRPAGSESAGTVAPAAPAPVQILDVSVDGNRLSVHAQDQDIRTVIQSVVTQGQIEVRHLEGLPNRRVSVRFVNLPFVEGLKRLLRAADVSGYALFTTPEGANPRVKRLVFLIPDETPGAATPGVRTAQRPPLQPPPSPPPVATTPPSERPAPGVPPPQTARGDEDDEKTRAARGRAPGAGGSAGAGGTVFDDLKGNATARRLMSQIMHPNEQVRERALESLVKLTQEDGKQRDLLEFLEPLMEDLASDDKGTQDEAREEIRKLLTR